MQTFTYSKNLKLLAAPIMFVIIFLVLEIINTTQWGKGGHPSNASMLFLIISVFSPLLGIAGLIHIKIKAKEKSNLKTISAILNLCIILYGIGMWLLWNGYLNA
jgi:hypothetical protein